MHYILALNLVIKNQKNPQKKPKKKNHTNPFFFLKNAFVVKSRFAGRATPLIVSV